MKRDVSLLSVEEKLEIISREAPELLGLLEEFKTKISFVREKAAPLMQR